MDLGMAGHVAIVTGSAHGIGSGIAKVLAREGVSVVINYRTNREEAETVSAEINAAGGQAAPCQADVSNPTAAAELVRFALDRFGRLDILVNNAGATVRKLFLQTTQEDLDLLINTNLRGVWNCCQAAGTHMVTRRYGRILNCSSVSAIMPIAHQAAYASSKAAVLALTKVMAGELAPYNIITNAVIPGLFETPMSRPAIAERGEELLSSIALRRYAQPEEMGNSVAFLVSPLNKYISGAFIHVDGGKFAVQNPMRCWRDAGMIP